GFFDFFFSSRRRHTRWPRDWSSDVCSSDLEQGEHGSGRPARVVEELPDVRRERADRIRARLVHENDRDVVKVAAIGIVGRPAEEIGRASCRERGWLCGGGGRV